MLNIAIGKSRTSLYWKNSSVTWENFCARIKPTQRTEDTVAEYHAMSTTEKSRAKDKGAFVGGFLTDNRRQVQNVEYRTLITLDADYADSVFYDRFMETCPCAAVIYTTHGHTPEKPRFRIVALLSEKVTPDCYNALARLFAALFGIDHFDEASFSVNQAMFWPSTPKDGEYICTVIDKPALDPKQFLADYHDWRDCSTLPTTSREKNIRNTDGRMQEDPLAKTGVVGALCRTYTIQEAIGKFLSDKYAPSVVEGRYDYIPGEGAAGVVIYDDKFAYSHHATDPASGKLLNAFDLLRVHLFPDDDEKTSYLKMCEFAGKDELVQETMEKERQAQVREDFHKEETAQPGASPAPASAIMWDAPIPFGKYELPPFPVDVLPPAWQNYVIAASESKQTPVDMAGCCVLNVGATSIQGKYVIEAKPGWKEQLGLYTIIIALSSERKSPIIGLSIAPLQNFEHNYNKMNAASVESSLSMKRALLRLQKETEDRFAKGKATEADMDDIAKKIAAFEEKKPLCLFVGNITPEKLAVELSENNGRTAILSSEPGIFDLLSGTYAKTVDMEPFLQGYSGDPIRVKRIGREECMIDHPNLTILLMAQPKVISDVLSNPNFTARGLTARFLYSIPNSYVGSRKYRTPVVPEDAYREYEQSIFNMLEDETRAEPEVITLSPEADMELEKFCMDLEPKLIREYAEIADWVGKLPGNVVRIAGILCRASVTRGHDLADSNPPLVVSGETMRNAIRLGNYFLAHALAAFDVLPEDTMYKKALRILRMIHDKKLTKFSRRDAMRNCQSFKRAEEIQPVLDFLCDYGYIAAVEVPQSFSKGRPPMPRYLVNPQFEGYYSQSVMDFVRGENGRK